MSPTQGPRAGPFIMSLLLMAAPATVGAQAPSFRLSGGGAMSGDYKAGWGAHGLAELSVNATSTFDLRGGASLAVGGFSGSVGETVVGLDVLGVVAVGSTRRPYLGLGLGYSKTGGSATQSLSRAMGVTAALGFEWQRANARWFTEARLRLFGNVFKDREVTRSVLLLSLGRTIG